MVKKVKFDKIYLSMKKVVLFLILLIFFYFVPNIVYGQNIADNIPGVSCGVANDLTGKDKCCSIPKIINCPDSKIADFAIGLLNIIPGAAFFTPTYDKAKEDCTKIQDFTDNNLNPDACLSGKPSTNDFSSPSCKCVDPNATANVNVAMAEMCYKYLGSTSKTKELGNCLSCSSQNGMWTGLGCLPLDLNTLITSFVLTTGIGLGGGFALLCIIYAAFMMQSSQGNPEKLKKAQEMITSCIMGLMLIIFSVFIMRIIGVNIIRIPGFQ